MPPSAAFPRYNIHNTRGPWGKGGGDPPPLGRGKGKVGDTPYYLIWFEIRGLGKCDTDCATGGECGTADGSINKSKWVQKSTNDRGQQTSSKGRKKIDELTSNNDYLETPLGI